MMYNQHVCASTNLYLWMSQLNMVAHFPVFTASNNLEVFHVALCICCTHGVCVCMCVREWKQGRQRCFMDKKVSSLMSGLIPLNLFSLFESKLIIASVNDGVIKKYYNSDAMHTQRLLLLSFHLSPFIRLFSLLFSFILPLPRFSLSYSWTNSNRTSVTSGKNQRVLLLWMQISKIFSKNGWSAKETTKKLFIIL